MTNVNKQNGLWSFTCSMRGCAAAGFTDRERGLFPSGPLVNICDPCRQRLGTGRHDLTVYCLGCQKLTLHLRSEEYVNESPDLADHILFSTTCPFCGQLEDVRHLLTIDQLTAAEAREQGKEV
jgi:hypothetical protein